MRELVVDAKTENLPPVQAFVKEGLEELGCSMKEIMKLHMVVDEIFTNISSYAYHESGSVTIRIDFENAGGVLSLTFEDEGEPFNPLLNQDPDIILSAKERKIGGLGIMMVKKTMDEIDYENRGGKNILTLKKMVGGNHA